MTLLPSADRPRGIRMGEWGLEFIPNRPCFSPAGWSLPQTDPVFRQRSGVCLKQTLFFISGLEFVPNRPCFSSAGWSSSQTDPVLHQRAGVRPKQTLFCISGLEFAPNRPCFTPQSASALKQRSLAFYRTQKPMKGLQEIPFQHYSFTLQNLFYSLTPTPSTRRSHATHE